VKPSARHGIVESFTLRLFPDPVSSVAGGAELSAGHVTCTIEPRGLVQFAQESQDVTTDVTGTLAQVLVSSVVWYDMICSVNIDMFCEYLICA